MQIQIIQKKEKNSGGQLTRIHKNLFECETSYIMKYQHLAQSCGEPWHVRALTVPSLHLVPELVLFQFRLACVPILCLVWEFLPTVWTEEFLSSRLTVLLLLLLLVVLVNVLRNLFLGLGDKKALLASFLVGFLAAHPTLVFNPDVFFLCQEIPAHPILPLC